jgi:ABC-type transporter Mla subunit MlaD
MPSEKTAQVVGVLVLLVAAGAIVWAFGFADTPADLPSYSLQSAVVLHAEMALALVIAAALPLLFIGRLLTGRFPDRISTQGAEWLESAPDVLETISDLQNNVEDIDSVTSELVALLSEHEERLRQAGV